MFVCWKMEKGAMRLDGWDVCFVRVSCGMACFVHEFLELRLLSGDHRAVKHCFGNGRVPLAVTTCTSAS